MSLHRDAQRIMMRGDQRAQVRSNVGRAAEPGRARRSLRFFRWNRRRLRVMWQVAIEPDGEKVPGRTLIMREDQIAGASHALQVSILHLPFAAQLGLFSRQGNEY